MGFHLPPGHSAEAPSWGLFFTPRPLTRHPPTWAQLPHQTLPCLFICPALFFVPCFAVRSISFSLPPSVEDRSLPCLSPSPESSLHLPPASCLSPHKAVWSCPLLSKRFLTCLGEAPFPSPPLSAASSPLPLLGKPAILPSLALVLAGGPFPSAWGPASPSAIFHKCWCTGCVPLSQQLADPHCKWGLVPGRTRRSAWVG